MWNGDSGYSGYGESAAAVTGADKPPVPGLVRWIFPVTVWRP